MSNDDSGNFLTEFGEDQIGEDNGQKWTNRGRPDEATNQKDGENWNEGYDPNMWCRHYLDGSFEQHSYGKKPSYHFRSVHGHHYGIVGNGNVFEFNPSSTHHITKGDVMQHYDGSKDQVAMNVSRRNSGTEKGGGEYQSAGKGGYAQASGEGGKAIWSDGNMNIASAGDMKATSAKSMTWGRGDEGGKMRQYAHMDEKGNISIVSGKGGGDISVQVENGNVKIAGAKGVSIEASEGDMTFSAKKGSVSLSAGKTINLGAGSDVISSHPLPHPAPIKTTFNKERGGVHSPQYNAKTGSGGKSEIA